MKDRAGKQWFGMKVFLKDMEEHQNTTAYSLYNLSATQIVAILSEQWPRKMWAHREGKETVCVLKAEACTCWRETLCVIA